MIDLMQATQTAVFTKLEEATALTELAPVFQHVPADTEPPMTIIGEIRSDNVGGKSEQCELITIEIVALYRGSGRAALLDIMHAQRAALDGQEIAFDGVSFDTPEFIGAIADGPAQDGITYAGISTFTIHAEPA